jgi:peptidyl-prolyl cis-trans isomerase SurA
MTKTLLAALFAATAASSAASAQQPNQPAPIPPDSSRTPVPPITPPQPTPPPPRPAAPDTAQPPTAPTTPVVTPGTPAPGPTGAAPESQPDPQAARNGELPVDRIVAIVGDQPILWSNVQEVVNQRQAQGMKLPTDSAGSFALANEVINMLIDEELLLQKAKAEKVEIADQDVAATVDQQMKSIRGRFRSESEYRSALRQSGFGTPEEYRRSLLEQAKRQGMQQRLMQKMRQDGKIVPASVSEADVTAAFEKNRSQLPKRPATITFRQIVVRPKASAAATERARAKAESLLVEIRRGGNFEQIAKRESMDDGTKETGGDLGWNRRGQMVPEFDRMMFALQPGQVSPVVETTFGFHIIRVDRVQPAEVKARHILIRPTIDSTDVARAQVEADSVAAQWRAGANLEALYAQHHDPDEDKGLTDPYPRDSLPQSYQKGIEGKKDGDVTDPFRIESRTPGVPKFVVLQVTALKEGGDYTVADLRNVIRDQLVEERSVRRFLDQLRRETYVSVRLNQVARGT